VHDVGNLRGNTDAVIEKGMVITVEPGLYFPKRIGAVPPCGVRIEDDVLVGQNGCTVLTPQFPKEMEELEALLEAIPK
jgi:Xaa-Pro aminopeptidase